MQGDRPMLNTAGKHGANKRLRRVLSVLLKLCIAFIVFCALLFVAQDSMIFHNVHDPQSREFLRDRQGFHEIEFTAEDGITRHGMMHRATDEMASLIIYFGGNGESSHRHMRGLEMQNLWRYYAGFHYLYIDYAGYGLNDGRPHYRNMQEGALAVFDFALTLPYVDADRIVAMGFSLGTGSAVYLAANRPVAGLIIVAPYANGYDLYNNVLPIFHGPMRLLVRQKFPSDQHAPGVTCPVLLIASRGDEIIPFSSSERLGAMFYGDVNFVVLDNVRHNGIFGARGVLDSIQRFLGTI